MHVLEVGDYVRISPSSGSVYSFGILKSIHRPKAYDNKAFKGVPGSEPDHSIQRFNMDWSPVLGRFACQKRFLTKLTPKMVKEIQLEQLLKGKN